MAHRLFFGRWIFLCIFMVSITGCRGCQLPKFSKDDKSKSDGLEKQPPARLELTSLQSLPAASESEGLLMKPGHWYELHQSVRANESDEALSVSCSAIERAFPFRPIPPAGLREPIAFERRISLARGQRKLLALEMFFPRTSVGLNQGKSAIRASYRPRILGVALREEAYPVTTMPDYQYYFVVLSQNPSRYQFVGGLSSMIWPSETKLEEERISPFRVVQIAQADVQSNLPTRLTTWTSTSHLLWNDCDASALVEKQQAALLDWLHFGGQLIVNGPESQAALKESFLSSYLPIKNLRAGELDQARWQEFSRFWTIARQTEKNGQEILLPLDREPPLIDGELAPGAHWVRGCEGLVAERFVGSGRVVMTTFSLGESMMIRWPSFSSFFNGALMHRPARVWRRTNELSGDMIFAGSQTGSERDPSYASRVRLLGRDLGRAIPTWKHSGSDRTEVLSHENDGLLQDYPSSEEVVPNIQNQGIAQIESDNAFVKIATTALQKASGIQVPRIKTIIQLLTGYLLILVPLNWLVFRAIGRVEFAWLAAPCIAIIGAVVVARSVQLDIGFSRSQTTLNLFELKSGYPRGHLSSFVSLYSSLSTQYRARYARNDGIVLPVNAIGQRNRVTQFDENELQYIYADEAGSGLTAFPVRSNSTSFLRGEEMLDLGGSITIAWDESDPESIRFQNSTNVSLSGVGIVAKSVDGQICKVWIGELERQANGRVRITRSAEPPRTASPTQLDNSFVFDDWNVDRGQSQEPTATMLPFSKSENDLAVGRPLAEIATRHPLGPGDAMLLGWTYDPISQLEIEPKASQRTEATLVIVRLDGVDLAEPGPDLNLPSEQVNIDRELPLDPNAL